MKNPGIKKLASMAAVSAIAAYPAVAANYTWTSATAGGNWSASANWTPSSAFPVDGDTGILGDVSSGTRTVVYDSSANGTITGLQFNQTTAGATNLLQVSRSLFVRTAVDLSASAGTEKIAVGSGLTFSTSATLGQALSVGANGELELQGTATIAGTGGLSISGGTLRVAGTTNSATTQSTVNTTFSMSSGTITLANSGSGAETQTGRSLIFSGNTNITGGTITTTNTGYAGAVFLNGATTVLNLTSSDTGLVYQLNGTGNQSLTTNQNFFATGGNVGLILRGSGVKTLTSTSDANGTINNIQLADGNGGSSAATTLKLGSNLRSGTGANVSAAGFANTMDGGGNIQIGIDTSGYTYDLSPGANSGVWTPNKGNATNTAQWTLSNSGAAGVGGLKANAFNFSTSGVQVNVGAGQVLTAVGGAGTATNLGSSGSFDLAAKFVYAGNAAAANPATLASGRAIGALEVQTGYLKASGASFDAAGGITVKSGAKLDFTTVALTSPSMTLDVAGASSFGQIVAASYTYAGALNIHFTSTIAEGTYDLYSFSGSATSGLSSVSLTGLASLGLGGSAGVWTGSTGGFDFTFTEASGDLVVSASAIPEPSTFALMAGFASLGLCGVRRRRRVGA